VRTSVSVGAGAVCCWLLSRPAKGVDPSDVVKVELGAARGLVGHHCAQCASGME
jgi:hypothetical protein